jgi:hypothetical protein
MAKGIRAVDAHVARGIARVSLVDLKRELVDHQVRADGFRIRTRVGTWFRRARLVGARERRDEDLEKIKEEINEEMRYSYSKGLRRACAR